MRPATVCWLAIGVERDAFDGPCGGVGGVRFGGAMLASALGRRDWAEAGAAINAARTNAQVVARGIMCRRMNASCAMITIVVQFDA